MQTAARGYARSLPTSEERADIFRLFKHIFKNDTHLAAFRIGSSAPHGYLEKSELTWSSWSSPPSGRNAMTQLGDSWPGNRLSNRAMAELQRLILQHARYIYEFASRKFSRNWACIALASEAVFRPARTKAARLTAEGMEAEFCKVLEYMPAGKLIPGSRRRGLAGRHCWSGYGRRRP